MAFYGYTCLPKNGSPPPVQLVLATMAVPADFKSHLATLSHLYFKASSTSTRIVGSSSVVGSSSDKWKVSIVSIPDAGEMSYFERTLSYKDIQSMVRPFSHVER